MVLRALYAGHVSQAAFMYTCFEPEILKIIQALRYPVVIGLSESEWFYIFALKDRNATVVACPISFVVAVGGGVAGSITGKKNKQRVILWFETTSLSNM